jgi:cell division protein FtsB
MKKKIEERVPAIAEVEKRRSELEDEVLDKAKEIKNLQDQLRETIKKQAKTSALL